MINIAVIDWRGGIPVSSFLGKGIGCGGSESACRAFQSWHPSKVFILMLPQPGVCKHWSEHTCNA